MAAPAAVAAWLCGMPRPPPLTVCLSVHRPQVIVLAAEGPVFSAGHDLKELAASAPEQLSAIFREAGELCMDIRKLDQPVIGRVHALATAAGCQLAGASRGACVTVFCSTYMGLVWWLPAGGVCQQPRVTSSSLRRVRSLRRRYAMRLNCGASGGGRAQLFVRARDAQCAMQGVHVGLFCSTPAVELSRSVSTKLAMEMLLTGEPITADRAREAGLVNRVVDGDEAALDEEVGWRA